MELTKMNQKVREMSNILCFCFSITGYTTSNDYNEEAEVITHTITSKGKTAATIIFDMKNEVIGLKDLILKDLRFNHITMQFEDEIRKNKEFLITMLAQTFLVNISLNSSPFKKLEIDLDIWRQVNVTTLLEMCRIEKEKLAKRLERAILEDRADITLQVERLLEFVKMIPVAELGEEYYGV